MDAILLGIGGVSYIVTMIVFAVLGWKSKVSKRGIDSDYVALLLSMTGASCFFIGIGLVL